MEPMRAGRGIAMSDEGRDPGGQEAPVISEKQKTSEIVHKALETYEKVVTVVGNPKVLINNYT
jgi:hypothetical protein